MRTTTGVTYINKYIPWLLMEHTHKDDTLWEQQMLVHILIMYIQWRTVGQLWS